MNKKTLLSGIQPTGTPHIGNYLGAIKPWVSLQEEYNTFLPIVDAHAITIPKDPKELYDNTLKTAAILIACGIDPGKSVLFLQSHVSAHFELAWILNTLTPLGELERMTQFKEKSEEAGVLAGLLNYPILMAADILLYQPDVVPVGEDQLQHLELTRTLARKFNSNFGETFKEPKALIQKETARIMGLDDASKKMSKSASSEANYISLLDSPEAIRNKIKTAVTDSGRDVKYNKETKPAISNLMTIYTVFSGVAFSNIETQYRDKGYVEFKNDLAEIIIQGLAPIQTKYRELIEDKKSLLAILKDGADRARIVADKTLMEAKQKMGFVI